MKIPKLLYIVMFLLIALGFWAVLNQTYIVSHYSEFPTNNTLPNQMVILRTNRITGKTNIKYNDRETKEWTTINR